MTDEMQSTEIIYQYDHIYDGKNVYGVAPLANGSKCYVIISTSSTDEIFEVTCDTKISSKFASSHSMSTLKSGKRFSRLKDIIVSPRGFLYVTDYYNYGVHKMNMEGEDIAIFAGDFGESNGKPNETQFKYPTSLACDHDGNIYILDYIVSTLRMISPDELSHTKSDRLPDIRFDTNISYDKKEHALFITSQKYIQKYDLKTLEAETFVKGEPTTDFYGITVDQRTGNLYVINDADSCIYFIERESKKFTKVEAQNREGGFMELKSPVRLRTDDNGVLYVADQKQGIFRIAPKKRLKWSIKRLLWIGRNKNVPEDCPLAMLPQEIVFEIIDHIEG